VELEGQLAAARAFAPFATLEGLERRLREKLTDWRGLLMRNVTEGRAVLRTLLMGPIRFTPIVDERRRGYAFEGLITLDRLLGGVLELPPVGSSPAGFDGGQCLPLEVDGCSALHAA